MDESAINMLLVILFCIWFTIFTRKNKKRFYYLYGIFAFLLINITLYYFPELISSEDNNHLNIPYFGSLRLSAFLAIAGIFSWIFLKKDEVIDIDQSFLPPELVEIIKRDFRYPLKKNYVLRFLQSVPQKASPMEILINNYFMVRYVNRLVIYDRIIKYYKFKLGSEKMLALESAANNQIGSLDPFNPDLWIKYYDLAKYCHFHIEQKETKK